MIEVRYNLNVWKQWVKRFEAFLAVEALQIAAMDAKKTILAKSKRGLDADGNRFSPYSKGHAARRKREGLQTSVVDLRMDRSGPPALLDSIELRDKKTLIVDSVHEVIMKGLQEKKGLVMAVDLAGMQSIERELVKRLEKM